MRVIAKSVLVEFWTKHYQIPDAEPREMLRFLMEQHGLKQEDLADCAPQSSISNILNGKRPISKDIAKKLARRFCVHADLFLITGRKERWIHRTAQQPSRSAAPACAAHRERP